MLPSFSHNPQKTEPFTEIYEDCMSYWTDDEIEAYKKEMIERQRMDRESSKAYTEDLIRDLSATIEARDATSCQVSFIHTEDDSTKATSCQVSFIHTEDNSTRNGYSFIP